MTRSNKDYNMDKALCDLCGLNETCQSPYMKPDERSLEEGYAADILFVGEAPGKNEDEEGIPFVGESGQRLRLMVSEVGLHHYGVVYTNVCRCRPPANKTPTMKQIRYCVENLWNDIKEYNPQVVVLLGNTPLKAILGESGITNWRGVVVERNDIIFMPTFHPAYLLRNPSRSLMITVLEDFEKVLGLISGEDQTISADAEYQIELVVDKRIAYDMYIMIRQAGRCAFDTETTSLRPFDMEQRIVMCSFAVDASDLAHPHSTTNAKRAWAVLTNNDEVIDLCMRIVANPDIEKIGHNIKFDTLAVYGLWDTWMEGVSGDSMLLSYIIDSQPGRHGLKMLAGRFLGMYDYDEPLRSYHTLNKESDPRRGGDLGQVPVGILSDYAAKDAIATLELHELLMKDDALTDRQRILYEQVLVPASAMFTQMEANGVMLDRSVAKEYIGLYEQVQLESLTEMKKDMIVSRFIQDRKKKDEKYEFNPNSPIQISELLFDRRHFGLEPLGFTKTGLPSTAWDLIKGYENSVPFLSSYRDFKLVGKALGTYLRPSLDVWPSTSDGRVRSSYRIHGTVTGRTASRGPNLQNIPTPEKEPGTILASHPVKNIFTHTHPDGCVLVADYAGMELRTMASVSRCKEMTRMFEAGQDVHSIVTSHLYELDIDEFMARLRSNDRKVAEVAIAERYVSKWVNWTLMYGGGAHTLSRLYGLSGPKARSLIDIYYGLFPEILDFKHDTLEFARENGYVESPFGRRRYLPYINDIGNAYRAKAEREAINMPIQSAASDVLLCALIVLDDLMHQDGFESMMVNTVHDSVMFDVWPDELDDLAALCKDVMENIVDDYGPRWFPGLNFEWFTVPLKADMEIGSHYGTLSKYIE